MHRVLGFVNSGVRYSHAYPNADAAPFPHGYPDANPDADAAPFPHGYPDAKTATSTPTPPPSSTATPTPTPTPIPVAIADASAEAWDCMLSYRPTTPAPCSGLYTVSVQHSPALQAIQYGCCPGTGAPRYSLHAGFNARVSNAIRHAMDTMSDWTGKAWGEVAWPAAGAVLRWYPSAEAGGPSCSGAVAGCALRDEITLHRSAWGLSDYPSEILYETALHEMGHALFGAIHSERGIMCIMDHCYRPLKSEGLTWSRGQRLTALDHEVYTLYGHLTYGMSFSKVVDLQRAVAR